MVATTTATGPDLVVDGIVTADPTTTTTATASYINTTMTQNYIATSVLIAHPKLCEIKGRSILHDMVQIQNCQDATASHLQNDDANRNNNNDTGIPIRIGRYCHIQSNTILQSRRGNTPIRYYGIDDDQNHTMNEGVGNWKSANSETIGTVVVATTTATIGSYTMIGHNCIISINHLSIGNQVQIGDHVTIGNNVTIKDNCIVESHTNIPPYTVIPPYTYCYNSNRSSNNCETTIKESEASLRRHCRLVMDVASLPPSVASVRQEQAVATYNALVRQQRQQS